MPSPWRVATGDGLPTPASAHSLPTSAVVGPAYCRAHLDGGKASCQPKYANSPNSDADGDKMVSTVWHETVELVTDPEPHNKPAYSSPEVGDLCESSDLKENPPAVGYAQADVSYEPAGPLLVTLTVEPVRSWRATGEDQASFTAQMLRRPQQIRAAGRTRERGFRRASASRIDLEGSRSLHVT